jgi:hypothetical protein
LQKTPPIFGQEDGAERPILYALECQFAQKPQPVPVSGQD